LETLETKTALGQVLLVKYQGLKMLKALLFFAVNALSAIFLNLIKVL
jgi:hypothetical protein